MNTYTHTHTHTYSSKFDLAPELLAEREVMRVKAFTKWERSHFKAMVDAVEAYGVHPEG